MRVPALVALIPVAAYAACTSFSSPSGNGSVGDAGAGDAGGAMCTNAASCSGSVVGTWNVTSSCLAISGALDLSNYSLGCSSAPITGSLQVTGTWTANADGTFTDGTTTTGSEAFTLAKSCLVVSSTAVDCDGVGNYLTALGYQTLTCTTTADGGCSCAATIRQAGSMGLVTPVPTTAGMFSQSAGGTITLSDQNSDLTCVSGTTMKMAPVVVSPTTTGAIVFQKGASPGSSGISGSSGGSGTGSSSGASAGSGSGSGSGSSGGPSSGSSSGSNGGSGGSSGSTGMSPVGPCDVYNGGGTPCVAAHSTVRALFGAYAGKLYQVRNAAGATKDISVLSAGGAANAAAQDAFCTGTTCVITTIYDQSGKGNDLQYQGAGSPVGGKDQPANATGESVKVGGNSVYSLYIQPYNSYWVDGSQSGVPVGSAPEGIYMVTSGAHFNTGCCFDYGNSETNRRAAGKSSMDALSFTSGTAYGSGAGAGPWIMADFELGLFTSAGIRVVNPNAPSQTSAFVTAVLRNNGTTEFSLRGGDATTGNLTTLYKGGYPSGWGPMKKQGAIVLGSGGDCCVTNTSLSDGTFYEGCIVAGYPTDATENALQANIVAAGYSTK